MNHIDQLIPEYLYVRPTSIYSSGYDFFNYCVLSRGPGIQKKWSLRLKRTKYVDLLKAPSHDGFILAAEALDLKQFFGTETYTDRNDRILRRCERVNIADVKIGDKILVFCLNGQLTLRYSADEYYKRTQKSNCACAIYEVCDKDWINPECNKIVAKNTAKLDEKALVVNPNSLIRRITTYNNHEKIIVNLNKEELLSMCKDILTKYSVNNAKNIEFTVVSK